MMGQCPRCLSEIPEDFGLLECGRCGAQLIMHMDGRVEHSGDLPPNDTQVSAPNPRFEGLPGETIAQTMAEVDMPLPEEEQGEIAAPDAYEEQDQFAYEESPQASEPAPEGGYEELMEPAPYQEAPPPTAADSPDLSDIARFGNSDQSGGREGTLRYNLFVSGIDTSDVRKDFREALTDRKFMWDIDQIVRSIKHGEVQIQNVTASKAYILITRLRALPLQIRWEQYAVSQS